MVSNLCEFLGEEPPKNLRKCIKCGEFKSLENFGFRSLTEQRNDCKQCRNKSNAQVRKIKKYHPLPNLDTFKCPYCKRTQDQIFKTGSWGNQKSKSTCMVPDHDHETGEFRAYCCDDCNTVIARAHEDSDTLERIRNMIIQRKQDLEL